jgi:hypothetical protein
MCICGEKFFLVDHAIMRAYHQLIKRRGYGFLYKTCIARRHPQYKLNKQQEEEFLSIR